MNFFFNFSTIDYCSKLCVPKFQNRKSVNKDIQLYQLIIENDKWIAKIPEFNSDDKFYYVENIKNINTSNFYFLASKKKLESKKEELKEKIIQIDDFTDTFPDFRSNIKVFNKIGGFSSYQSEIPLDLVARQGSIIAHANILLNKHSEKNIIFFVNLYYLPVLKKFNLYFIDKKLKKVLSVKEILTNSVNEIKNLNDYLFGENIFLFTKDYLGFPVFLSENNGQISFEHTHPPQENFSNKNKFDHIKKIKEEFNEIIYKENI